MRGNGDFCGQPSQKLTPKLRNKKFEENINKRGKVRWRRSRCLRR